MLKLNFYKIILFIFIVSLTTNSQAQNTISVPFLEGFVGVNSATNKATNSIYLTALGWSNIQFSQNSPQFVFVAQGNDIPGTVLITDFGGTEHAIPGFIKWRAPSGGNITTPVFEPTSGGVLATNSSNGSATYSITTMSYIGLTYNGDTLVIPSSGNNIGEVTGNAATTGILSSLNSYLGNFPTISISDTSTNENVGNKVITVTLSSSSSQTITVNFSTVNNTAVSGSDYVSQSGTLTFNAGDLTKTITLSITDDSVYESDETFYVQLSNATNASIVDPSITITILNDDALTPSITSTGTLTTFNACAGTASAEQSISVSGTNLVSDITVTAPNGYELSLTSGGSFSNSVTLTQISGSVSSTPIYIRLKNNAANGDSGNIVCLATNATSVNVSTGSATVNQIPSSPTGVDGSRTGSGTVAISGSVSTGETIDWYAGSTGGSPLTGGTGTTSFTTPSISSTTVYYAETRNTSTSCISANRTAVTATIQAPNNNGDTTAPAITYPISQNNDGTSSIKISENTAAVTTYTANETVTWSITGGSEQYLFSIDANTGALTFDNPLPLFASPTDSAPTNSYIVEITATDGNGNYSRQTLIVTISPFCGSWGN